MKTLILANAFKGSLSAGDAGKIIQKNLGASSKLMLISDGGDGIIDVFKSAAPAAKIIKKSVRDAYGIYHKAPFLLLPDGKTAVIETAKICGLGGIKKCDLKPLVSTSYGVGEMIARALKLGVKNFYIGLGGVACNDGGAGCAAALGVKFHDGKKNIPAAAAGLLKLKNIDVPPLNLSGVKFFALTDVTNPLLGPRGSAAVFGPQKCRTKQEVKVIAAALKNYARVIKKSLGRDVGRVPGAGAAGAIAAGLYVFLNAEITPGARFIFKKLKIENEIKKSGRVIITEGCLDAQTFMGKAPGAAVELAKKYKKEIIFICGKNKLKYAARRGIKKVLELSALARRGEDSMRDAAKILARASEI
ncbi:MAG: glycerate kinase [Elusimicrobium sp.]|jgi:glycerate kinase|nr:glycerate kinase [Elusimicrobium sp.]